MPLYRRPQRSSFVLYPLLIAVAIGSLCFLFIHTGSAEPPRAVTARGATDQHAARQEDRLAADELPQEGQALSPPHGGLQPPDCQAAASPPASRPAALQYGEATAEMLRRCEGAVGGWCTPYYAQAEVPAVTAPPGNKTCNFDCNGVGNCNMLTGMCQCPAGWTGDWCTVRMRRPCASLHREHGWEPDATPADVSLGLNAESHWAFPGSHCAGSCDEDLAACFCPEWTPYGRVAAPKGSPPGTPPVKAGRPMGRFCQPNKTEDGQDSQWGVVDPDLLYNPSYGWCTSEDPRHTCDCILDGLGGRTCNEPYAQTCLNQCSGHGECHIGFCKCHAGWFGHDCAHHAAGVEDSPDLAREQPWVAENVHTPAARDFPPGATRRRPLIYVYELPPIYNSVLLQYRLGTEECVPRLYTGGNVTVTSSWTYALETGLHEMLLQSEHRTLNPEEADYFYVPIYTSCYIHPVRDFADHPWWYSIAHNRAQSSTNMQLEAWHWLRSHYPYWDRRGGRDHIWLVTHDEASCYVPAAIRPSIILSHWGRKDLNHTSGTGYGADNYSAELHHPEWEPHGYQRKIAGHACYDPEKDMVVPVMKRPEHYHASPLLGAPARERTWLCFHRGRVQFDNPQYSRGLRQRLARAAKEGNWLEKHRIVVGGYEDVPGDYSELLAASKFCLVVPGDGWSARMDDSVLHGCVPVIIMDDVDVSWNTLLDWGSFSLRIPESDAERLPEILLAVDAQRLQAMQRSLAKVWRRFAWSSYRPYARQVRKQLAAREEAQRQATVRGDSSDGGESDAAWVDGSEGGGTSGGYAAQLLALPLPEPPYDPDEDDAFQTLMQWLFARIPDTR